MINEELAKRAKQAYSFYEYEQGSATKDWELIVLESMQMVKQVYLLILNRWEKIYE